MSNVDTIKDVYAAFGRGDVEAILEVLADDVEFESWADNSAVRAGVPWLQPRRGKEGAVEFFAIVGGWQIREFSVLAIMDGGDKVAAEIVMDADPPNAAAFRDEELHLWDFDERGKITRLRHYVDTAKHIEAAGVQAP